MIKREIRAAEISSASAAFVSSRVGAKRADWLARVVCVRHGCSLCALLQPIAGAGLTTTGKRAVLDGIYSHITPSACENNSIWASTFVLQARVGRLERRSVQNSREFVSRL